MLITRIFADMVLFTCHRKLVRWTLSPFDKKESSGTPGRPRKCKRGFKPKKPSSKDTFS